MFPIFKKELRTFFSNATGYIVIGIFLIVTGLFLWVIPGMYNILETGYANIDGLFYLAPWLFLFLCPAVTMRLFAEEKQNGTWELLATKPISISNIVLGKYLAGFVLVSMSLIPTIIYYYSVWYMAEPIGNIDSGAYWGSFIGLLFLALVYVAIGTFASSLSSNQIVAFIVAIFLCFFFYYGFDVMGSLLSSAETVQLIQFFGIHSHYQSMSRGVIDSRDVLYFITLSVIFLATTVLKLRK
jgi:ABC-2 type transport system permease protein